MKSRISGTKKCTIRNFSFIIYKTIKYIFRPIQPQKSNVNCKKKSLMSVKRIISHKHYYVWLMIFK